MMLRRILFIADGRSPTALNWIRYFVDQGYEVHLASTFPCAPDLRLASLQIIPVAFSRLKPAWQPTLPGKGERPAGKPSPQRSSSPLWSASLVGVRTGLRQWLGPFTLPGAARHLKAVLAGVRPDLVHAMRIPYEGMLAALASPAAPLLISVWGNDFTLHAPATPLMGHYTRLALRRSAALHADCRRDIRLAGEWGLPPERPTVVLPGAGGLQLDLFYPPAAPRDELAPLVINPRGIRAYLRTDTFFRAVPIVLQSFPRARFVCPAMAGERSAVGWCQELGIAASVDLLPTQTRPQMAEWFRRALVAVSPSTHDGTPNTLLEAMACGCFPIAGDIEALREWISPGENGLLVDPANAPALAAAILAALEQPALRQKAQAVNLRLVAERVEYRQVMAEAEKFYRQLAG